MIINVEELGKECIINVVKTSMFSKIIGSYFFFLIKVLILLGREFRDVEINVKYWLNDIVLWIFFSFLVNSIFFNIVFSEFDFFFNMVVEVVNVIKIFDGKGGYKYLIKVINVLKVYGKSFKESIMVYGYVFNCIVVF